MSRPVRRFERADAVRLDEADPLRGCRDRFALPDGMIYLDGNSLGALPRNTPAALDALVREEWGGKLIGGWNNGWLDLPRQVGAAIAPLIGAAADEVLATDSVSVNLFKLVGAALEARPERSVVLCERDNFATDLYVAEGAAAMAGKRLRVVEPDAVEAAIGDDVAVLVLTHVHFRSGEQRNMRRLTAMARERGMLLLWDLSHSTGAVPLALDEWGVELAVGCGYKYLNGGPGAPAFLFVARRLQERLRSPLRGWFGHARPFEFENEYEAAAGIDRFSCGTPSVPALTALRCGVASFDGVDLPTLFAKGAALGDLLIRLVEQECDGRGLTVLSPRDAEQRGSHVLLGHNHGYAVCQALIRRGVVGDFRPPNGLRLGFAPLYNGFAEVWDAVAALRAVLDGAEWDRTAFREKRRVS